MLAERQLNGISPKKGGRPQKYKNEEERLRGRREAQRIYMERQRSIPV